MNNLTYDDCGNLVTPADDTSCAGCGFEECECLMSESQELAYVQNIIDLKRTVDRLSKLFQNKLDNLTDGRSNMDTEREIVGTLEQLKILSNLHD